MIVGPTGFEHVALSLIRPARIAFQKIVGIFVGRFQPKSSLTTLSSRLMIYPAGSVSRLSHFSRVRIGIL